MYANSFLLAALLMVGIVVADHHGMHGDDEQNSNSTDDDWHNPREALLKYVMQRASPRVPPPPRYLPIKVQVKLRPMSIRSVCTKTYHVEVPTLEMYNWTDPRLAWNTSDFGGVEYIDVAAKDIWMPDIAVWQSPSSTPMQTRPKEYKAVITHDGNVLYIPLAELSIECDAGPWKRHDKMHNSGNSQSRSRSRRQAQHSSSINSSDNETESSEWSSDANNYKTYMCEFDQGPWIYDISVVDVIPVSTGTPFAEHHEGGNETESGEETSQNNEEHDDEETSQEDQGGSQRGNATKGQQQQFSANDFDSTADLSWFDGNEFYDIESFTSERLIERYTSFPVDWASIHYHLVVKVNMNESEKKKSSKKSKKIKSRMSASSSSRGSGRRGAAASAEEKKAQDDSEDTDDEDDKKSNSENDD